MVRFTSLTGRCRPSPIFNMVLPTGTDAFVRMRMVTLLWQTGLGKLRRGEVFKHVWFVCVMSAR